MGQFQPPDSAQQMAMDQAVSQCDSDIALYQSMVGAQGAGLSGALNWVNGKLFDSSAQDAAIANAQRLRDRFADWSVRQMAQVLSGDQSLEGWFSTGQAIHSDATYNVGDMKGWTFSGIVSNTASATATDVNAGVATVSGSIAKAAFPVWAMAVVVLVLVLAIKVT